MLKRVLFVISIYNYHREVEPVVYKFIEEGWQVDVLLGWHDQTALDAESVYEERGAHVLWTPFEMAYGPGFPSTNENKNSSINTCSETTNSHVSIIDKLKATLKGAIKKVPFILVSVETLFHLRRISRLKKFTEHFFNKNQYSAIFQGPFHSVGRLDNAFYCQARTRGVPNYCYPVSAYHGHKIAIQARHDNIINGMLPKRLFVNDSIENRCFALLYKRGTISVIGERIFLNTPPLMLAR